MTFTLPKYPMTYWGLVKTTLKLWWAMVLPLLPLSFLAVLLTGSSIYLKLWISPETQMALFVPLVIIANILYLIPSSAMLARLGHAIHGQDITNSQAFGVGLMRFSKMLILSIILLFIMTAIVGVGILIDHFTHIFVFILIFILLALLISPYLICAVPLVILDNKSPWDAIQQSIELVQHHWGFVTMVMFVLSIVSAGINLIGGLGGMVGSLVVMMFTLPLTLSMSIMILEYLKQAKEHKA